MSREMSGGGDLLRLRSRLKSWTGVGEEPNHLILVSMSGLGMSEEEDEDLRDKLNDVFQRFKSRRGAEIFHVSPTDTGILVKLTEYNQLEMTSELKVDIIRVIQQDFAEYFGQIDQSRLLRILNLQGRLQQVIKFLETYDDRAKETGIRPDGSRMLQVTDIQSVRDFKRRMGRKTFAESFIRKQVAALIGPGRAPVPVMSEYFISVDMIREHVLKGVEFRGSGSVFTQLTRTLDQMVIECLDDVNPDRAKCSLNMNVETIFTHAFQNVIEKSGERVLANVVIEFRMENILQNWDQFQTASALIKKHGGTIAIDAVIPETIGLIDLPRLDAKLAKIFWRPGADAELPLHRNEIRSMQEKGTVMVLARVDDQVGIETGQSCGITMFQGFHVDNLLGK